MAQRSERKPRTTGLFSPRGLVIVTVGVFTLAAAGGGAWQWWYGLPPEIDGPATLNKLASDTFGDIAHDSPDNAVVHYRTLFVDVLEIPDPDRLWSHEDGRNTLYQRWQTARRDEVLPNLAKGAWDDPRQAKGMALLEALRPILEPLDLAADARGFRPRYSASSDIFNPDDSNGPIGPVDIRLPYLGFFRSLGELNNIFMREAANEDDWPRVVRRLRTGLRHAQHTSREPFFISALVGISIEAGALQELRFTINEHDIPRDACDALIAEMEGADPIPDILFSMHSERLTFPSVIREMLIGETGGLFSPGYWRAVVENPPPRLALRDGERFHDELDEYLALPYAERSAQPTPNAGAAAYYLPSYSRVINQFDAIAADRAATLALLRLERFRAEHGRWPTTLEEAMTPEQTLEPLTGKPFVYLVGSDGLRPEIANDAPEAYLPSDLALERTRNMNFEKVVESAGPRWPFTLLAPTEAGFMRDSEFTTRRGVIWEPPVRDASLR